MSNFGSIRAWVLIQILPSGERGGLPAWPISYPSGRLSLDDVLHILLIEDGEGKPALLDVYDMLATKTWWFVWAKIEIDPIKKER